MLRNIILRVISGSPDQYLYVTKTFVIFSLNIRFRAFISIHKYLFGKLVIIAKSGKAPISRKAIFLVEFRNEYHTLLGYNRRLLRPVQPHISENCYLYHELTRSHLKLSRPTILEKNVFARKQPRNSEMKL